MGVLVAPILQRTTVGIAQIKIQAVATCLFLCMDTCGSVYGSKEFSDDCIFNEQMEQHHYNTYSSTQHSNARRTLYLALNKTGQPRKIQIPVNRTLGKLATYTKALTQTVAHERVEQLVSRLFGADHVRHGLSQLCETGQPLVELTAKEMRPRPTCGGGQAKGSLAAGNGKKQQQQQQQQANASGANRTGPQQTPGGGQGPGGGQQRKPKKPTQQPHHPPSGPGAGGKRNGTGGNANKPGGPARSKLVAAALVPPKANPKPASLTIARPVRPTTSLPVTTPSTTAETFSSISNRTPVTTMSNALQDTSQQSEDTELDMDDVLQPSGELADDLDELDEGNLNLAGHALNFVDEEDLYDMEF
uniref:Fibroblast growth factor n=1 Tax=Anopheles atroparvus TaxID=41427 RepID=A0A182IX45_ANOAO